MTTTAPPASDLMTATEARRYLRDPAPRRLARPMRRRPPEEVPVPRPTPTYRRRRHPFEGVAALVALVLPALAVGGVLALAFLAAYRWLAEAVAGLSTGAL